MTATSDDLTIPAALDRRGELSADAGSGVTSDRTGAKSKPSWRDHLKVHPAANLFPMMSEAEKRELGESIKKEGLLHPAVVWQDDDGETFLLDGRNRLDAAELVGVPLKGFVGHYVLYLDSDVDPYEYVIAANLHRRHLTSEQKRELIANVLKAKPEASNRSVAKQVKADDKTVAKVRRDLNRRSEIPNVETRTDTKGRKQPAAKARNRPRKDKSAEVSAEERRAQFAAMESADDADDPLGPALSDDCEDCDLTERWQTSLSNLHPTRSPCARIGLNSSGNGKLSTKHQYL